MKTNNDLVSDYLRAVEQALAGAPVNRRAELLADLSEHIAAKRAELAPEQENEVEIRSILQLLGDPEEVAAEALLDAEPSARPPSIEIQPKRRSAAVIWVAVMIAAVASLCVLATVLGLFLLARSSHGGTPTPVTGPGASEVSAVPTPTSSPAPTPS